MRQRIFILLFLVLLIAGLIGLNALSYTKTEERADDEFFPNRSSYNSGTTGTSAFYSLLLETGNKVVRWQQAPSALHSTANGRIKTLVLIGETRREISDEDAAKLMSWVEKGGRLVLIDRFPNHKLLKPEGNWRLSTAMPTGIPTGIDALNPVTLIDNAAKPVQPTTLMNGINAVQPSKLASSILIEYKPVTDEDEDEYSILDSEPPPAERKTRISGQPKVAPKRISASTPAATPKNALKATPADKSGYGGVSKSSITVVKESEPAPGAPVIHLSGTGKDILADFNYGAGRVIFLSDPYIVSNTGIKHVDNATLAINMVSVLDGTIAFDEYHQGFGSENTILRYFSGTPIPALFAQGALLILVLLWTQGKRFGRPLPLPRKDRRSKLEYIAAMADLQQGTRSYDLAIENIYRQTKRDLIRFVGADNTIPRKQLAETVAERAGLDAKTLYLLMAKCEDIIHGEPTNAKETMNLISQLRALEEKLGFHRNKRNGVK